MKNFGALTIEYSHNLTSLEGFEKIKGISGSVNIHDNSKLTNLCALVTAATSDGLNGEYMIQDNGTIPHLMI